MRNANKLIDISLEIGDIYEEIAYNPTNEILPKTLLSLKTAISQEKKLYQEMFSTIDDCISMIELIESKENADNDEMESYAINRVLNKLKYMYLECTYSSNGAYKHIIDMYTQILYSEFMGNSHKYPQLKSEMQFSAFYCLALSPIIERDVLYDDLVPSPTYSDKVLLYANYRRELAQDLLNSEIISSKNSEKTIVSIDDIYRQSVENFINPYLEYTLKILSEEFKKDSITDKYHLYPLTELKAQLAMLPKPIRERKYQETLERFKKEKTSDEKLTILKQAFLEVETEIITKIEYISYPSQLVKH